MIKPTKDYTLFTFRDDNRKTINYNHVEALKKSITSKNLLHLRPVLVNKDMEILDGQHRLLAAKDLGLEIWYEVQDLEIFDLIRMNVNKDWKLEDHLNFYVKNGFEDYIKLNEFMKKHKISATIAINMSSGKNASVYKKFKDGEFVFKEEVASEELEICWDTIDCVKKLNGSHSYLYSSRLWHALVRLIQHPDFKKDKWMNNLPKVISSFSPKARTEEYIIMLQKIYNWRNLSKITLKEVGECDI